MLRKIDTRYDSSLLMLLSANWARRRTLMITIQIMHTWSKSWVVEFRKKDVGRWAAGSTY